MKKLLSILLTLISFAGYAQMNTFGGIGLRVNDTTTYQTNAAAYHSAGYSDIYFNNQATRKHYDVWNATLSAYEHVYRFDRFYPLAKTYTTNHTIVSGDTRNGEGQIIMNNASAATVTLSPDATTNFPAGTNIYIVQGLADSVTLSHPGVTINKCATCKEYTRGRLTIMALQKTETADTWNLFGTADTGSGGGGGSGDVVGPSSATDAVPVLFDGTTGKLVKNSTPTGTGNPVLAASPALTGNPTAPTQSAGNNSTRIATTAYADAKVAEALTNGVTGIAPSEDQVFDALALKASLSGTETLTNKRINPRIQAVTSSATVTPNADSDDAVKVTAQAAGITFANPSGTPAAMQALLIRLKDNGTARAITWGSQYRGIGIALPSTTVISKTQYFGLVWNSDDSKWDVVGYSLENFVFFLPFVFRRKRGNERKLFYDYDEIFKDAA